MCGVYEMTSRGFQIEYDVIFSKAIFVRLTSSGYIDGAKGAVFLKTSNLSQSVLHAIWDHADTKNEGELDINGFIVACRLVAHSQAYNISNPMSLLPLLSTPPPILPKFDLSPFSHEFDPLFTSLDVDSDGFLTGKDARAFYLSSTNHDSQTLMRLWDLADIDCDGLLSKQEFYTMQLLIESLNEQTEIKIPNSSYQLPIKSQQNSSPSYNIEYTQDKHVISNTSLPHCAIEHDKNEIPALPIPSYKTSSRTNKGIPNDVSSVVSDGQDTPHSFVQALANTNFSVCDDLVKKEQKKLQLLRAQHQNLLETVSHSPNAGSSAELELLRSQADDLASDIADLKLKNESILNVVTQNESNLSSLHTSKKNHAAIAEKEEELLKAEQRELEQLKITLQAMKRNKQLLQREGNRLNERLKQNETTTKIMLRALENEQSKILSVKNERLLVSKEKLQVEKEMRSLSNQALMQVISKEKNTNSQIAAPGSERDSKGIRVVSVANNVSQ